MAQSVRGGGSMYGNPAVNNFMQPQQATMSRFANTRGSPYGPKAGQIVPRTYTDFYRAQSYLQSQSTPQMAPIPPRHGGFYPNAMN